MKFDLETWALFTCPATRGPVFRWFYRSVDLGLGLELGSLLVVPLSMGSVPDKPKTLSKSHFHFDVEREQEDGSKIIHVSRARTYAIRSAPNMH